MAVMVPKFETKGVALGQTMQHHSFNVFRIGHCTLADPTNERCFTFCREILLSVEGG